MLRTGELFSQVRVATEKRLKAFNSMPNVTLVKLPGLIEQQATGLVRLGAERQDIAQRMAFAPDGSIYVTFGRGDKAGEVSPGHGSVKVGRLPAP